MCADYVLLLLAAIASLSLPAMSQNSFPAVRHKPAPTAAILRNRAPLESNNFYPLPLGAIEPRGCLRKQLEIQAAGLTGHLDGFWSDLTPDSAWLGGQGEAWDRGPYFLDGLLPLAYLLDDPALKAKANRWIEWTLAHQRPDGEIGPPHNNDWWPRMVMLKALTQYQEATGGPRVIPLMQGYFSCHLSELPHSPLKDWGKYRWPDMSPASSGYTTAPAMPACSTLRAYCGSRASTGSRTTNTSPTPPRRTAPPSASTRPATPIAQWRHMASTMRTKLTLIPYAFAKLRITAFPVATQAQPSAQPTASR